MVQKYLSFNDSLDFLFVLVLKWYSTNRNLILTSSQLIAILKREFACSKGDHLQASWSSSDTLMHTYIYNMCTWLHLSWYFYLPLLGITLEYRDNFLALRDATHKICIKITLITNWQEQQQGSYFKFGSIYFLRLFFL